MLFVVVVRVIIMAPYYMSMRWSMHSERGQGGGWFHLALRISVVQLLSTHTQVYVPVAV